MQIFKEIGIKKFDCRFGEKATIKYSPLERLWKHLPPHPNNDRPTDLPTNPKRFSDFAETSLIISSEIKMFTNFRKFRRNFFFGKKSELKFQNRGYFRKKVCPQIFWN